MDLIQKQKDLEKELTELKKKNNDTLNFVKKECGALCDIDYSKPLSEYYRANLVKLYVTNFYDNNGYDPHYGTTKFDNHVLGMDIFKKRYSEYGGAMALNNGNGTTSAIFYGNRYSNCVLELLNYIGLKKVWKAFISDTFGKCECSLEEFPKWVQKNIEIWETSTVFDSWGDKENNDFIEKLSEIVTFDIQEINIGIFGGVEYPQYAIYYPEWFKVRDSIINNNKM